MPGGDGTGPMGQGPMTGRGAGYCAGFNRPGFANSGFGRGRGFGRGFRGRGFGFGRGFGWRRMAVAPATSVYGAPAYQPTKEEETHILEEDAKAIEEEQKVLKQELDNIKKRLAELRK